MDLSTNYASFKNISARNAVFTQLSVSNLKCSGVSDSVLRFDQDGYMQDGPLVLDSEPIGDNELKFRTYNGSILFSIGGASTDGPGLMSSSDFTTIRSVGQPAGIAQLDNSGRLPLSQLPDTHQDHSCTETLQATMDSNTTLIAGLQTSVNTLVSQIDTLGGSMTQISNDVHSLEARITGFDASISNLTSRMTEAEGVMTTAMNAIQTGDNFQEAISSLVSNIQEQSDEAVVFRNDLDSLASQVSDGQNNSDQTSQIISLQNSIATIMTQLNNAPSITLAQSVADIQTQLANVQSGVDQSIQITDMKQEITSLSSQVSDLKSEDLSLLQTSVNDINSQIATINSNHSTGIDQLTSRVDAGSTQMDALEQSLIDISTQINGLEGSPDVTALQTSIGLLQDQVTAESSTLEVVRQGLEDVVTQIDSLQGTDTSAVQASVTALSTRIDQDIAELRGDVTSEVDTLQQEVDHLNTTDILTMTEDATISDGIVPWNFISQTNITGGAGLYTINRSGMYNMHFNVRLDPNPHVYRTLQVTQNGNTLLNKLYGVTRHSHLTDNLLMYANVGDTVAISLGNYDNSPLMVGASSTLYFTLQR